MKKIVVLISILVMASFTFASSLLPKYVQKVYVMDYDKNTSCLVRHLKVYKEPRWVSKIELTNGKKVFFSSPKSMFEFYHRPGKWYDFGVKSEEDFKDIIVSDYETLKLIDAKKAYFVYGSRAQSPGGDDLPAFSSKKQAEHFAKKYNGKRVMSFKNISPALIKLINGRI